MSQRSHLIRRLSAALVVTVCVVASAQERSQDAVAVELDKKILAAATKDSQIMANLMYLSDIIGPRLTGSAALKRANEWAAERMKAIGLTNVHQEGWIVPLGWERISASAKIVEPDNGRSLLIASAGWSPSTKGKVIGEVVVLDARTNKDLEKYRGKLKNAIILRGKPSTVAPIDDPNAPATASRARAAEAKNAASKKAKGGRDRGDFDPANFTQMMAFRRELADFLRHEGAACMLMDSAKPQGLLVTTGSWRGRDRVAAEEPLPSAYIAHEHYSLLYRLATRPQPAKTVLEIEITNKFIPGPITCYNTVGEIKGTEKPDELVILGAHIDSWDLASGTTDNGTGTSVVLEAARILNSLDVKPKRTIRFVLFSGEEQGLHGSKAYVDQHKSEIPKMSMCLVHDTGTGRVNGIGLQGREVLKPILEKELASLKEIGVTEINLERMGGSDHASFDAAGVPGFAVRQNMFEYRFTHHTQSDTYDKANEENLIQGAQVMAVSAMRVANYPTLLPRDRPAPPRGGRKGAKTEAEVPKGEPKTGTKNQGDQGDQ
jgi:hypothetical protein